MDYLKKINWLDHTLNQNWVKLNIKLRGLYNTHSQIKFKTSMLRSSLCDSSEGRYFLKKL